MIYRSFFSFLHPRRQMGGGFFMLFLWGMLIRVAVAHGVDGALQADFLPPPPGSYKLNVIMKAPDGVVLDIDNKPKSLSSFTTGKITLLGFVYTTCPDAKGCPLAYKVFHDLKREIENTPWMHEKIRFVSLSFDPEHDTPDIMRVYGGEQLKSNRGLHWDFLTAASYQQLQPLLDGFGQDLSTKVSSKGKSVRGYSHVLKVFLIDQSGAIREIYTTAYLVPAVVLNDMKTLLMEKEKKAGNVHCQVCFNHHAVVNRYCDGWLRAVTCGNLCCT